ncbi:MAG: hypothetical protein V4858_25535 [Pseudomonadota bacterium]
MNPRSLRRGAILALAVVTVAACNPALNWREVRVERLVALLPCKPDHARRDVQLGALNVSMQMTGCEASGGLYAISHVRVADPSQAAAAQIAWRQASLIPLQPSSVQTEPFLLARPRVSGQRASASSAATVPSGAAVDMLRIQARRPDGSPLQARLLWFTSGADIYHVAVYGPNLTQEMSEMLFSELLLQ